MPVVVRAIRPGEAARLKDVRLRALADAPYAFASTFEREAAFSDDEWVARADRWSNATTDIAYFAEDGERLVGLVAAFLEGGGPVAHVVSMWTAPEARRTGVGRALLEAVAGWACEVGAAELQLWVARDNGIAIRFYESMGFERLPGFQPIASDPCREELRMVRRLSG